MIFESRNTLAEAAEDNCLRFEPREKVKKCILKNSNLFNNFRRIFFLAPTVTKVRIDF